MLDLAQLGLILRDLDLTEPVAAVELAGGSSRVFRIDLSDGGAVVLKTYADHVHDLPGNETYAARLLIDLGVPVTRYLTRDASCDRLPFPFAITNHLPGNPVLAFRNEPDAENLYREMGVLLRKLHSVTLPGYGLFNEGGIAAPVASHDEHLRIQAADAFRQFRAYGGDAALAAKLEGIVASRTEVAGWSRGAVFAHDDLHPGNVLAERGADGRLRITGLIDFGSARAGDAVSDLAKALFCSEHDFPGCTRFIREGYGSFDHPDPERALWLHTLLHRVVMWWWLRHVGVITDGEEHGLVVDLRQMADGT